MKEETILEAKMQLANTEQQGERDSSFGLAESGLFAESYSAEWISAPPELDHSESAIVDYLSLP